jgi:S-adenosylmethionine:tRNA ribosyltransferase-isomerase
MFLSDFDYELPDALIARYPAKERRASRLLLVGDELQDLQFGDLPDCLSADDLLVFNDTRVIRARLRGTKDTGGRVELLVERITDDNEVVAQVRASKSPRAGSEIRFADGTVAAVLGRSGDMFRLRFDVAVDSYLQTHGEVPLPPYLGRDEESADGERYQTVYARHPGAVAAPTAGLHFDEAMLAETRSLGVRHAFVTLHVGAGTFQPLREKSVAASELHAERVSVPEAVCEAVRETRQRGGRVIAVGTTSVRALESASAGGDIEAFDGETSLFIKPGYRFRAVDAMLTNFHLPKSSLLVLVSAYAGRERILAAYRHAVREQYRFFSYGDAMLIFPAAT